MIDAFLPPFVMVPINKKGLHCLVKKGETVDEGQTIAVWKEGAGEGEKGVIHSPVPGKVEGIIKVNLANGIRGYCIKIETGGRFRYLGRKTKRSASPVMQTLLEKGVLNTFDSIAGPSPLSWCGNVKELVVCLGDEDPSVKTTAMLSQLMSDEVKQGAAITASAVGAKRVIFAGEEELRGQYEGTLHDSVCAAEFVASHFKRYPSTFKTDLKDRIKDESADDVLFVDANTMINVQEAVLHDTPSMTSYVYLAGECLKAEGLLKARVGTPIRFLAEQCGSFVKKCDAIIINGFMLGYPASLDTPIDKYVKSVMFVPRGVMRSQDESECISCGNCREVCPKRLLPDVLFMKGLNASHDAALCTGCGLCNSVCPSRLPLVQNIMSSVQENALSKKGGQENG